MKSALTFWERAYLANLTRRRVLECWNKAKNAVREDLRLDWAEEARHGEILADLLDEGEIEGARVVPLQAHPNRDLDYLDDTGSKKGAKLAGLTGDGALAPEGRSGAEPVDKQLRNARGDRPASGGLEEE